MLCLGRGDGLRRRRSGISRRFHRFFRSLRQGLRHRLRCLFRRDVCDHRLRIHLRRRHRCILDSLRHNRERRHGIHRLGLRLSGCHHHRCGEHNVLSQCRPLGQHIFRELCLLLILVLCRILSFLSVHRCPLLVQQRTEILPAFTFLCNRTLRKGALSGLDCRIGHLKQHITLIHLFHLLSRLVLFSWPPSPHAVRPPAPR